MERKVLAAKTTVIDQELGQFEALVSTWTEDREKDVIDQSAFDKTIRAWGASGRNLPLLFEHSTTVVGSVVPESMHTTAGGLVVAGEVDRSTEKGQQVWRSIKSNTAAFSIGYMSESRARPGGGREIIEIDLLEISYTSTPMNANTRALSWKSAHASDPGLEQDWRAITAAFNRPREEAEMEAALEAEIARKPIQIAQFSA